MTRRLLVLFAVLGLLFAACGDDGGVDEITDGGDQTSEDADGGGSGDDGSGDDDALTAEDLEDLDDAADAFLDEDCEFLFDLSIALSQAVSGNTELSDFAVSEAPEEVRGDIEVLLEAYADFLEDPQQNADAIAAAEVQTASDNLSAYLDANCSEPGAVN